MDVQAQENFRTNLRTALKVRGLTQTRVAELAKTSNPYVNRVLQGQVSPSLEQCEKLARAVGFPLIALLENPVAFEDAVLTRST